MTAFLNWFKSVVKKMATVAIIAVITLGAVCYWTANEVSENVSENAGNINDVANAVLAVNSRIDSTNTALSGLIQNMALKTEVQVLANRVSAVETLAASAAGSASKAMGAVQKLRNAIRTRRTTNGNGAASVNQMGLLVQADMDRREFNKHLRAAGDTTLALASPGWVSYKKARNDLNVRNAGAREFWARMYAMLKSQENGSHKNGDLITRKQVDDLLAAKEFATERDLRKVSNNAANLVADEKSEREAAAEFLARF